MLRSGFHHGGYLSVLYMCVLVQAGDLNPLFAQNEAKPVSEIPRETGVAKLENSELDIGSSLPTEAESEAESFLLADLRTAAGKILNPAPKKSGPAATPKQDATAAEKGTSSDKVRKSATAELPLDKLDPKSRQRVDNVLREVGFFRRMPSITFAAEPSVYHYFVQHPDVAVSIWRAMEISELKMWQTGPNEYEGDATDGTTGIIDVLLRGTEKNLVICEGEYKNPLLKRPIKAKSIVLLQTSFSRGQDGTSYITHRADLFVTFPSQTVETAAKFLSPLTGRMVDNTFLEMSRFLRLMTLAMCRRPVWVEQLAAKLDGVHEVRREQLVQLTTQVHAAEKKRLGEDSDTTFVIPVVPGPAAANPVARSAGETTGSARISYPASTAPGASRPPTVPRVSRDTPTTPRR